MIVKKIIYNNKVYYIDLYKIIKNTLYNDYNVLSKEENLIWKVKKTWSVSIIKDISRIFAYLILFYIGFLLMTNSPWYNANINIFFVVLNLLLFLLPIVIYELILTYFFTPIEIKQK